MFKPITVAGHGIAPSPSDHRLALCGALLTEAIDEQLSKQAERSVLPPSQRSSTEPTYPYLTGTLLTLRSRRFYHEPLVCEIMHLIPGTECYLVDMQSGNLTAYAHDSELRTPKKGESGWYEGIDYDD